MENWYLPITIVPGIGLLILSTSNLLVTLSNEIKEIIEKSGSNASLTKRKLGQLKFLNSAMVLFYISVACLVTSGLIDGLRLNINPKFKLSAYISILGIIFILGGLFILIIYSYRALKIRQDQFKKIYKK